MEGNECQNCGGETDEHFLRHGCADQCLEHLAKRIAALEAGRDSGKHIEEAYKLEVGRMRERLDALEAGQRREEPNKIQQELETRRSADVSQAFASLKKERDDLLAYTAKLVKAARGTDRCNICGLIYAARHLQHDYDCLLAGPVPKSVIAKLEEEEKASRMPNADGVWDRWAKAMEEEKANATSK